jgi:hypothetical protein
MKVLKENAKAVIAFFTTLGTWGTTALADGQVDGVEAFGLGGVIVATFGVWTVTNAPTDDQLVALDRAIHRNTPGPTT